MPAQSRSDQPALRAGVRKPPKNEPAGSGERFAVYGDLVGRAASARDALVGGSLTRLKPLQRWSEGCCRVADGLIEE